MQVYHAYGLTLDTSLPSSK